MAVRDRRKGAAGGGSRVPRYDLYAQVGHLLRRAHQRHTAIFQAGIGEAQLTPLQLAALAKLHDEGALSQNRLGRLTGMDPATSLGVIRRLRAKGLVERSADPDDGRRSVLRLTAAGETLLASVVPAALAISTDTLAPLDGDERRVFLELLRKLV